MFFLSKVYFLFSICISIIYANEYIDDLKKAKPGECYKKVLIPAKYATKEELIEVEKASKKIIITDPKFKNITKSVIIVPKYTDIKDTMAEFETKEIKLPITQKKIYYTISKDKEIPLSDDFVKYVKKKGVDLDKLKVNECYFEYFSPPDKKKIKKEYIKKQAYEIIDVAPAKFKIIKKKIQIKPAYTKIVKTPAIYETKIIKVLVFPAKKDYVKKADGSICVVEKPAVYKEIVKKIMKTPPLTKIIKFPAQYKEIEVKVLDKAPQVTRRVIPQKKESYDFIVDDGEGSYFWLKNGKKTDAKPTGLKICKKEKKAKYITRKIEVVKKPATTIKVEVLAKKLDINISKLISDANATLIELPPQYQKVKTKILISPAKVVWKKISCELNMKSLK